MAGSNSRIFDALRRGMPAGAAGEPADAAGAVFGIALELGAYRDSVALVRGDEFRWLPPSEGEGPAGARALARPELRRVLGELGWLCHVVVASDVKPSEFVDLLSLGADEDNRAPEVGLSKSTTDVKAMHAGQHDVQDHQVGVL